MLTAMSDLQSQSESFWVFVDVHACCVADDANIADNSFKDTQEARSRHHGIGDDVKRGWLRDLCTSKSHRRIARARYRYVPKNADVVACKARVWILESRQFETGSGKERLQIKPLWPQRFGDRSDPKCRAAWLIRNRGSLHLGALRE